MCGLMQDNYHIRLERSLRDDEISCSLRTFLKVADKLGAIDHRIILDDHLPNNEFLVPESLNQQVIDALQGLIPVG